MFNRRPGAMLLLGHKHQCGKGPRLQSRSLAAYSRPLPRSHRLFNPAPPGAGLLCLFATISGLYAFGGFFVYVMALGLGFLIPDFWLGNRIKARQTSLRLGLPDAL